MESPARHVIRGLASANMKKAAERYNKHRDDDLPPLKVGDVVTLAVDRVDRGPIDDLRVAGVVVEVTKNNNYRIGLRAGCLQTCMGRGELQLRPNATHKHLVWIMF